MHCSSNPASLHNVFCTRSILESLLSRRFRLPVKELLEALKNRPLWGCSTLARADRPPLFGRTKKAWGKGKGGIAASLQGRPHKGVTQHDSRTTESTRTFPHRHSRPVPTASAPACLRPPVVFAGCIFARPCPPCEHPQLGERHRDFDECSAFYDISSYKSRFLSCPQLSPCQSLRRLPGLLRFLVQLTTLALTHSLSHPLTHSFTNSLTPSIPHALTQSLTHSLTQSRTDAREHRNAHTHIHSHIHLLNHPRTQSLTHQRSHSRTNSCTHGRTQTPIQTHSFT